MSKGVLLVLRAQVSPCQFQKAMAARGSDCGPLVGGRAAPLLERRARPGGRWSRLLGTLQGRAALRIRLASATGRMSGGSMISALEALSQTASVDMGVHFETPVGPGGEVHAGRSSMIWRPHGRASRGARKMTWHASEFLRECATGYKMLPRRGNVGLCLPTRIALHSNLRPRAPGVILRSRIAGHYVYLRRKRIAPG
ncbi:hypothetical protein N9L68_07705 [bacterium]|nr:hypothetical protein [bacterium]